MGVTSIEGLSEAQAETLLQRAVSLGSIRAETLDVLRAEWVQRTEGRGATLSESCPLGSGSESEGSTESLHLETGVFSSISSLNLEEAPPEEEKLVDPHAYPVPDWNRYEPLAFLGAGAMGIVFKAFDPRLRRIVALKFLPYLHRGSGDETRERDFRRFLREARTQAGVDHPHVAKVYEIGEVEDMAYLAIQFIEGAPLGQAGKHLSLREKVELMEGVAQGLHAVHRLGLIHRDIKPSNILVARGEGGRPRGVLTDFGLAFSIAKVDESHHGHVVGTPAYMSPEQSRGELLDTRSDVYSLGATLYELLTGQLPFSNDQPLMSLLAKIQSDTPRSMRELNPEVPRDLEAIVARCMEKKCLGRYDSALALAEELRRFLDGRPVQAVPSTLAYRTRRWVGRSRALAGLSGLLVSTVLVGGVVLVRNWRIGQLAIRDEAETSKQVSAFLTGIFTVSNPGEARGNAVTARELLDQGAKKIDALKGQPKIQARLMGTIGEVYLALGLYQQAQPLLERSLAISSQVLRPDDPNLAQGLTRLGNLHFRRGAFSVAGPLYERALHIQEKSLGPNDPVVAASLGRMADIAQAKGHYPDAEALYLRSLRISEKASGPDGVDPALLNNLASLYGKEDKVAQAEAVLLRTLRLKELRLGPEHLSVGTTLMNLANTYDDEGKCAEAEPLYQRSLKILEKTLGPDHHEVGFALSNIGLFYYRQGRYSEAESLFQRSCQIYEKALGPDHPEVAETLYSLANLYRVQGFPDKAEPLYLRSLKIREKALGPENPDLAQSLYGLASNEVAQGHYAKAEPLCERSLSIREKALGPKSLDVAESLRILGLLRLKQGELAKAEPLCQRSLDICEKAQATGLDYASKSLYVLACLRALQGRKADALACLRRALPAQGGVRWDGLIRKEPSLASLRGDSEFERIAAEVDQRRRH